MPAAPDDPARQRERRRRPDRRQRLRRRQPPLGAQDHAVCGPLGRHDRDLSAYAGYTSIFHPPSEIDANRKPLAPIEGKTVEQGLKSGLFGQPLLEPALLRGAAQRVGHAGVELLTVLAAALRLIP
jgi:hypothetical protein